MKIFFLSLLLLLSISSKGQDIFKVHELWTDVSIWYNINDKVRTGGDFGYRTTLKHFSFHQVYIRPTIRWKPKTLYSFSLAFSNFYTTDNHSNNVSELRLAEQATLYWPKWNNIRFSHRLRFEQRSFLVDETREKSNRMRYRLGARSPDFDLLGIGSSFYAAFTWENFTGLGQSFDYYFSNAQRWEFVLGNKVSDHIKIGLHYFFQLNRSVDESFVVQENVIRIRLAYNIN